MLTRVVVRNFKRLADADIELGRNVVLIGPNNSGKTTALQALALWDIGLRKWNEKRSGKETPGKRPGVTINRRDLVAVPVPQANLLWRDLHLRDTYDVDGKPQTSNVRIDVIVSGVTAGEAWECGLEFDYANEESIYCRPLRKSESRSPERMVVPEAAGGVRIAFLPPMSGLAANEVRLDVGAINVRIGEGRTADVLRNLCYQIASSSDTALWDSLHDRVRALFGVELDRPVYVAQRGEVTMTYREASGTRLDISSSGRGLQQTLLLLTHLYANPGTVLLLDEPDAHLEILRQRQTYQLLTEVATERGSQVVAASHSEVILNEAAGRDIVIAFVGRPHRIDGRGSQVLKALRDIGFEHYYQAEETGWVLYLEGSTDLAILQSFSRILDHEASRLLARPFAHYVGNKVARAREHFYGIQDAKTDLVGVALFDRVGDALRTNPPLREIMWSQREIENYLCSREVLLRFAENPAPGDAEGPLFEEAARARRRAAMERAIEAVSTALRTLEKPAPFSPDLKASDDFLAPVFGTYFQELGLPNLMNKSDYHVLAQLVKRSEISGEVSRVLDVIVEVAGSAKPASG